MKMQKDDIKKHHLTIGLIGGSGNGKTTLTAAMTKVLALKGQGTLISYEEIHNTPRENIDGITISAVRLASQTDQNRYTLIDFSDHDDYMKSIISGSYPMDGVILVQSATDHILPKTREQIVMAQEAKIPYIVVYMNQNDQVNPPEYPDNLEIDIRDLLSDNGFYGNNIAIIRGNALRALTCTSDDADDLDFRSIHDLLIAIDMSILPSERARDLPFLMPVEGVYASTEQGTIISGKIERGKVEVSEYVEIVGIRDTFDALITSLEMFRKNLTGAEAGDSVNMRLRGLSPYDVVRGQVLAKIGSIRSYGRFEAHVYLLSRKECGLSFPFMTNSNVSFYFHNVDIMGTITFSDHGQSCMRGYDAMMNIELTTPVAMEEGMRFRIREGGNVIGLGIVTGIL
jgi:elongation factor Tu